MIFDKYIRAFWYMSNNFGDNLNYFLLKNISGKDVVYTDNRNSSHLISCGSILTEANEHTVVWGAGFAWHHDRNERVNRNNVLAVRGELTAERFDNPNIRVGDPALLTRNFFNPVCNNKEYKYGIIPHWKDIENIYRMNLKDVLVINPLQDFRDVVNQILSCEKVISSSLHGLILCDVYEVPNSWLELGTDIGGDGFKFLDYYSTTESDWKHIESVKGVSFDSCQVHKQSIVTNAENLLNSFPK